ncbi:MAG: hypothetical protein OEX18_03165 [Candidatus Krumholzibacteria bacterium]|nr:hypothetical protein [Candidatus Krumholzibacteria bacterium]MDH4336259.1 hypothetical protein [Candidatus Krumholzibacteria bacterium]MDH5269702.1 hypothetical protein [Candidatus Krumholzibacteria bacterium]
MREELTRERLVLLMKELARCAPRRGSYQVYLVGGGTAVYLGWRRASIDADLFSEQERVFRDIQAIKERLDMNVEFARPEDFVPPLKGTADRHVFIDTIGAIGFYHYDPYAQVLSKVVRGFQRDLDDAREFVRHGLVDPPKFRALVAAIPDSAYARYPSLSRAGVERSVDAFVAGVS